MASIVENNASNNPCQLIGRAVSKNHHTITEHDLSTFFGNVASAFGQESDGKTEAFDLMNNTMSLKSHYRLGSNQEKECIILILY